MRRSLQSAILTSGVAAAAAASLAARRNSVAVEDIESNEQHSQGPRKSEVSSVNHHLSERTAARKLQSSCSRCHVGIPWAPQFWLERDCIFDQAAGSMYADYPYSRALKESNVIWNESTMDAWLTDPKSFIPGNSMSYTGLKDPVARQEIISILKSFCDDLNGTDSPADSPTDDPSENAGPTSLALERLSGMWIGPILWAGTVLISGWTSR